MPVQSDALIKMGTAAASDVAWPVASVAELSEALGATTGTVALDLARGGARFFLVVR